MIAAALITVALLGGHEDKPVDPAVGRRAHMKKVVAPYNAWLNQTAECESGSNWSTNTGNGYFGGLQFSLTTWQGVGGRGWPHLASRLEQKYRGVLLLRRQGTGAWPVCGRH